MKIKELWVRHSPVISLVACEYVYWKGNKSYYLRQVGAGASLAIPL